jgi:hypothetical protein
VQKVLLRVSRLKARKEPTAFIVIDDKGNDFFADLV